MLLLSSEKEKNSKESDGSLHHWASPLPWAAGRPEKQVSSIPFSQVHPLAEEQLWVLPGACSFHFHSRLRGRLTRDCREVRCPGGSTQSLQLAPKQMMPANLGEEAQGPCSHWRGGQSSGWSRQVTTEHNGYGIGAPPSLILPSSVLVGAHRVLSSKRWQQWFPLFVRDEMSHLLGKSFLHVEASGPVPAMTYRIKHLLSYDLQWVHGCVLGWWKYSGIR